MSYSLRYLTGTALFLLIANIGLSVPVFAIGPVKPLSPGFGGNAAVMVGGVENKSNLDTKQSDRLDSLTQLNTTDGRELLLPTFELNYNLKNEATQFYLGTPVERFLNLNFGVEIGVRQHVAKNKVIRIAYLPAVLDAERWADPFLIGVPRTTTDQSSTGILVGFDSPVFTLNYAQGKVEIEDERSGSALDIASQDALRRDGNYHALAINLAVPIKQGVLLQPSVVHVIADLDGEAMAHTQTSFDLGLMLLLQNAKLRLSVGTGNRRHDADNPAFGQRQQDELLSASILYLRDRIDVRGKPGLTLLLNHNNSDSNINFLDESRSMLSVGLRWSF
ncbi:MAG: DUF2860 family protein [Granulosicoccaceae bacterium]